MKFYFLLAVLLMPSCGPIQKTNRSAPFQPKSADSDSNTVKELTSEIPATCPTGNQTVCVLRDQKYSRVTTTRGSDCKEIIPIDRVDDGYCLGGCGAGTPSACVKRGDSFEWVSTDQAPDCSPIFPKDRVDDKFCE